MLLIAQSAPVATMPAVHIGDESLLFDP